MDLQSLETTQLQRLYQLQRAMLRGTDPDSVTVPDGKDNDFFIRSIERTSRAIANDSELGAVTDVTEDRETPQTRWRAAAERVKAGGDVASDDILLVNALAHDFYGFPFDATDGVSEAEAAYLDEIIRDQERGRSIESTQARGADATTAFEAVAAQTRAEAERDAAELARLEREAANGVLTIEAGAAALGYGTIDGDLSNTSAREVIGFNGGVGALDGMIADNQEALQRHFRDNIIDIRDKMYTTDPETGAKVPTEFGVEVMTYLVKETDLRGDISAMLTSGDEAQIQQAQALLRLSGFDGVDITGAVDQATADAAIEYLETPKGLGDTTLEYATRGETPDISAGALHRNIVSGGMADFSKLSAEELAKLPPQFAEFMADMEGVDQQTLHEEMAFFLEDRANYNAYNEYLASAPLTAEMAATVAALQGDLDELEAAATHDANATAALERIKSSVILNGRLLNGSNAEGDTAIAVGETIDAKLATGDVEGALTASVNYIDLQISQEDAFLQGIVEHNLESFQAIEGFEGKSVDEIMTAVEAIDSRAEVDAFMSDAVPHLGVLTHPVNEALIRRSAYSVAKGELDEFRGEPDAVAPAPVDIHDAPAGEAVVAEAVVDAGVVGADGDGGPPDARAIVTEAVVDDGAEEVTGLVKPPQDEFYAALDIDLVRDRDMPREIRGLASFKRNIESRLELIEGGDLSEARESQLKIEIAGFERRFDGLYSDIDPEMATEALEQSTVEPTGGDVVSQAGPTEPFHLAGFGLVRPGAGSPHVAPDQKPVFSQDFA